MPNRIGDMARLSDGRVITLGFERGELGVATASTATWERIGDSRKSPRAASR